MKKLAITNLGISFAMLFMLIVAAVIRVKQIFSVFIGIYCVLLDVAVLIVSAVTGILLWKFSKET
jgi:hypothetical protein